MLPVVPPEPAVAPDRIGPYRLLRPISAGGMARVYEGRLDSLAGVSTRVAVKVIHPDFANEGGFQELFIQEARVSARLEHLNVVRVQAFNLEGDLYYLVMEYIDGVTFRKIMSACRKYGLRVPPGLLAELGRQACEGLHYAHVVPDESGQPLRLVHRDMKPSNLMLNVQGVVKVLDFGISYASGQQESRGSVKGTWGYMAPEQAEGEPVGPTADLFGLAAVLYEVATLDPLFPEQDNATIRRLLAADEAARRAAGLGGPYAELGGVLVRALQRDPAARHRSAEGMARALGALVPDPMSARDELVRFVAELRRLDQANMPPPQDRSGSKASISTMRSQPGAPPGPGGLPVVTGSAHAPARPARSAPPKKAGPGIAAAIFSGLFALFSLGVLIFTAWTILSERRPRAVEPVAPAVVSAPAPVVAPAPPAVAPPADAPPPASPPAEAAPVSTATAPAPTGSARPAERPAAPRTAELVAGLATDPAPQPTPSPSAAPAASAGAEAAEAPTEGVLSVSASPRAQVMIDGVYVRFTPLFQHSLPAGTHTVLLATTDGRTKTFKVDVPAGGSVRKVWDFDEDKWAELAPE